MNKSQKKAERLARRPQKRAVRRERKQERKASRRLRRRDLVAQIRMKKPVFAVWLILRVLVLAVAVRCLIRGEWESLLTCALTEVLFLAPPFIEKSFHLRLPSVMEVAVMIFIFCAEVLGEIGCFYIRFPVWDTMLHTINGFLFAAFGFCLADLLNETPKAKFHLSPPFLALVAFCFSMTIGIIWEFFEFSMDHIFVLDMQKDTIIQSFQSVTLDPTNQNIPIPVRAIAETVIRTRDGQQFVIEGYLDIGLADTIKDLFVNFIGAAVFSVIGWIYVRRRGRSTIAAAFIPVVEKE